MMKLEAGKIREDEIGGVFSAGDDNAYKMLVGKLERKRPLGRPSRRWEDNRKMDRREIVFGVWIGFICLRIGTLTSS
jgi:hypothetical protein